MKESLESFKRDMADLRHYIRGIELESRLLFFPSDERSISESDSLIAEIRKHYSEFATKRRQFNYNSIIVSLYGFLEQFVESLISAYIQYLNMAVPEYDDFPEEFRKSHISLSLELIKLSDQPRYSRKISTEQIISNLHSCINKAESYRMNMTAFTRHTANFRADVIQEIFAKAGVKDISGRVRSSSAFIHYLKSKHPDRNAEDITPSEYLFYLNDLAERRNEVAHGSLPEEVLSNDLISDYIDFLKCYAEALYEVVYSEALSYMIKFLKKNRGVELGKAIKIFPKIEVIGILLKNVSMSIGDLIVAETANSKLPYLAGEIKDIRVGNVSYKEISADSEGKEIGIRVSFKAKENQKFFLIPKQRNKNRR